MANFLFPHYPPIKENYGERGRRIPFAETAQVITYTIAVLVLGAWPAAANDEGWQ